MFGRAGNIPVPVILVVGLIDNLTIPEYLVRCVL
jgi:hypothetical protein